MKCHYFIIFIHQLISSVDNYFNVHHYYSKNHINKDLKEIDDDIKNKIKRFIDSVNNKIFQKY